MMVYYTDVGHGQHNVTTVDFSSVNPNDGLDLRQISPEDGLARHGKQYSQLELTDVPILTEGTCCTCTMTTSTEDTWKQSDTLADST